jgi:prepilin-type N-terminal cleavage/methylation domain-containing protein
MTGTLTTTPRSTRESGYNLIELLIAIALLGVVMLSILSLFIWGRKNVYSGKQMTTAISIGTRAMEDLAPLTKGDIYNGVFDIAHTATGTASLKFGFPEQTYTNAAVRSTNTSLVTGYLDIQKQKSTGPKFLDKWNALLYHDAAKTRAKLLDGAITLVMMPNADPVNSPDQFGEASVLKVRVIVSWSENRRRREVILDTAKAN